MAKKRKPVVVLTNIDTSIIKDEELKPKCFGSKMDYCIKELCHDYYDQCRSSDTDDILNNS